MIGALKEKFVWVGLAIISVLAYIFTLQSKNKNLKLDIEKVTADRELDKINNQLEEAREESADAEENYKRTRDKYLAEHDGTGSNNL